MSILLRPRGSFARPPSSKLSSAFLKLPPGSRAFHASPRPQFLETIISPAHALFEGIHSATGLPWAATIPLTALAVRTFISLPVGIYVRRNVQKQMELWPLLQAWQHTQRKEVMKEFGHLGPAKANAELLKKARLNRIEIFKRHGCENRKNWLGPVMQLPVFLVCIEAMRKMAGTHEGLLGLISKSIFTTGKEATDLTDKASTAWFEPSFATEGAFWFKDLTVADPELLLPFILSGSMLLHVSHKKQKGVSTVPKMQRRINNILLTMALAAGPLLLHMPSGVILYWISSMLLAFGQEALLNKVMPMKQPIRVCEPRQPLDTGRVLVPPKRE